MTPANTIIERSGVFFLLLILPLVAVSVVVHPGVETQPEYTAGNLARLLPEREWLVTSVVLMLAAALAALGAGSLLFIRFRPLGLPLVTPSTLAMLAAGLLILGAGGAGLRISQLATEWLSVTGAAADQLDRSAVKFGQLRFMLGGLGVVLLLVSLIFCGVVIHRMTMLPRWLFRVPVASGVILIASPLGFVSFGLFAFLTVSALVLFAWLIVEAGWLIVRGTVTPRA